MKRNILIRTVFLFSLFLFCKNIQAQEKQNETYVISEKGSVSNIQPYIDALNNSDMRSHRLKNTSYIIIFSTGVKVKMLSATECNTNGRTFNLNDYPENFDSTRDEPVFSLGPNNFIMEQHKVTGKYK